MYPIDQFNIPEKAVNTYRFSGCSMLSKRYSIAEHTFEVTYYALLLINKYLNQVNFIDSIKYEILECCLIHDVPETLTGDISYIVKRSNPEFKKALNNLEDQFWKNNLPELYKRKYHPYTLFILKFCDTLAVAREIIIESELNNRFFYDFISNIQEIFDNLFHNKEVSSYEEWETLKRACIQIIKDLNLHNGYVNIEKLE